VSDGITLRPATGDDINAILEVLKASLGETPLLRRTQALYDWKHVDNPFGPSIVLLAEVAGRIAGVRALMRWELKTPDGGRICCARAVDTATHPDFQGRGVFRSLTMAAVEEAREKGIGLIFNTPNEKSAPGYLKMGWKEVGWLRPFVRPRLGQSVSPGPNGLPDLMEVLPIATTDIDFGAREDRHYFGLRTPRTAAYQEWRFVRHPSARYGWVASEGEPGGAVVRCGVRSGRTELIVSELSAGSRCLRSIARSHRARYVAALFGAGTPERKSAFRAGMCRIPGLPGLRLVANPLVDLEVDVFDPASWDLSMSDVELL
jgi:GNAT superfamily N-acetyltransferase